MDKPKIPYLWRFAALILLTSIVVYMFRLSSSKHSPEFVYDKYFVPYEAPLNLRGADIAGMDDDFMLGLIKYDQQKYSEAITLFQKAYEKDEQNYTARFLTAIAYMSQKDFAQAEPILKELSEDGSHLFQDQAKWYLGLLYLSDADADETNNEKAEEVWELIQNKDIRRKTEQIL